MNCLSSAQADFAGVAANSIPWGLIEKDWVTGLTAEVTGDRPLLQLALSTIPED
ncbi:MAG: hypothetical protein WCA35_06875 [Kovacikia sp.]